MSDGYPSVSIIVLNWNGKKHLAACLESLLTLDFPRSKLQIILCDNGSRDGSVEFVRRQFESVTLVALDRNYGFAEGNNRAVQSAVGEWVGFLNNDMWVEPSWLKNLLEPSLTRPQLRCLASRIVNWDGSAVDFVGGGANFQGHGFQIDHGERSSEHDRPRRLLFACGGAMLMRRDLFFEVGGFDPDFFAFFEDVDLGWRLNLLGHDVWYTPAATAHHRHHGTANRIEPHQLRVLYERNALAMIYKCFDDDNLAAALPAALLLMNERALRMSGVDVNSFDLDSQARRPGSLQPPTAVSVEGTTRGPIARGRRVLREEGLMAATRKGFGLGNRWLMAGLVALMGQVRPRHYFFLGLAASHYVAQSQFAHRLDSLNEKRQWIQSRRTRSDADLLPLLVDPFYNSFDDARYVEFYRWLCKVQGLDRRFSPIAD
jgi:GT2 family glycosyltransferase